MFKERVVLFSGLFTIVLATGCSLGTESGNNESPASPSTSLSYTSPSTSISDGESGDTSTPDEFELPISAAISEVAGYSEIDVATAVNNARFESIVDCMTAEGWDFDYKDLPEAGPTEEPIAYFGSQIQYYLDQIAAMQGATEGAEESGVGSNSSVEFEEDEFECWVQAENQYPDPLQSLWTWLAQETEDLDTRVNQDPRLVAAKEENSKCIAASGYDVTSIEGAANLFNGLASEVWERLQSGEISPDQARSELRPISEQVSELEGHVRSCDAQLEEVAEAVRQEYEEAFLEENGDRIALIAEDYADLLNLYQAYLEETQLNS